MQTGDLGTGDLRDLYKDGPLCPNRELRELKREKKREKGELKELRKEKRKRERKRRATEEERRPLRKTAAEDTEDQCKVISDGSGDF